MNSRPLLAGCFLLALTAAALAQPKPSYEPTSTHIFPAGGRRGTTVQVRVGTECAPPLTRFHLSGAGVTAPELLEHESAPRGEPSPRRLPTEIPITYPREWDSEIVIGEEATDTVFWRLSCAQGGTVSRPFVIGDLPEFIESESNSAAARAEPLSLPVTVNGQIHGERDVDYFCFDATAGEIVSCEVMARRLGSALDPVVELLDARGQSVEVDEAHVGDDLVLAFRAPASGKYLLRVANVTFHGSPACVYRINLTKRPFLLFAFPGGGRAGTLQTLSLHAIDGSGDLQVVDAEVELPAAATKAWTYRHEAFSGSVSLDVEDAPNVVEIEDNDSRSSAQTLAIPSTTSARFFTKGDEDWFRFQVEKDQRYTWRSPAGLQGGDCLPAITLFDGQGNQLASAASVESSDRVARIEWTATKDGDVFLRTRHLRYGLDGGAEYVYRLSARRAEPAFALRLKSDNVNLVQGGEVQLDVAVDRSGGFQGPVQLNIVGLPEGITAADTSIPADKNAAKIKLTASEEIPVRSFDVRFVGRAEIGGEQIEAVATAPHLGLDSEHVSVGPAAVDQWHLTICHKPLFRLYCAEAYQYAHRGSIHPYLMQLERLDGFDGEVTVQRGDRQNRDMDGIEFLTTVVPGNQSEFIMPIYLPETMHINVQSQSQLYCQAFAVFTDKHNQRQSVLVLSEKRNMIRTQPPVVKLRAVDEQIEASASDVVRCRFVLERTTNFPGPMTLTLLEPADGRVSCRPTTIPANETTAELDLSLNPKPAERDLALRFRAVGSLTADTKIVTETVVHLEVAE